MAVYAVIAIDVFDQATYARYSEGARKALEKYDIEYVSVDNDPVVYEGARPANHLVIVRFASRAAFESFYASEEYRSVVPFRSASSHARFIMLMQGGLPTGREAMP